MPQELIHVTFSYIVCEIKQTLKLVRIPTYSRVCWWSTQFDELNRPGSLDYTTAMMLVVKLAAGMVANEMLEQRTSYFF